MLVLQLHSGAFTPIPDVWMEFEEVVSYGGCEPQRLGMREGQAPPSSARVGGSGHKHEKFLPTTGKQLFPWEAHQPQSRLSSRAGSPLPGTVRL